MKTVRIIDGLNNDDVLVLGDFEYIGTPKKKSKRDEVIDVLIKGQKQSVHVYNDDWAVISETLDTPKQECPMENEDAISENIRAQFQAMESLVEMIVDQSINGLIISGAPGVGKSHHLINRLNHAVEIGELDEIGFVKGKISPVMLYKQLYEFRHAYDVLVFDDTDSIFTDEVSLNMLKAVLDSGEKKVVDWKTVSTFLEDEGIPNQFEFNGSIIFVSNLDFDRKIKSGGELAKHLGALISRTHYIDLGIHTNEEIMIRIKQVVYESSILETNGLSEIEGDMILDWMEENKNRMRELSIRTILKLAPFVKSNPNGWMSIANATMIKKN